MHPRSSLSSRVAGYFGALFLISIGALFVLWYFGLPQLGLIGASEQRLGEAMRILEVRADLQQALIANNIKERRGDILVVSENEALAKVIQSKNADDHTVERIFERLQRAYPDRYRRILIVDPATHRILASNSQYDIGRTFDVPPLIQRAAQAGATEIIEPVAVGAGNPELAIVRQIQTRDAQGYPSGKPIGILVVYADMQQFVGHRFVPESSNATAHETTLLFDAAGKVLAGLPATESDAGGFQLSPQTAIGFEGTLQQSGALGQKWIVVYRHVPFSGAQGWTLVHYTSEEGALASLQERASTLAIAGLLLTLVALALIALAARRITRPLHLLAQTARELGMGNLYVRAQHRARDSREIAALADAFNAMAGSVQESHHTLELKVRERTTNLLATLDAIPDLLFELDLEGRYQAFHSPRNDLLVASPKDLLGKRVTDVMPHDAAAVMLAALQEANRTGRSHGRQFALELPHGKCWFELSVARKAMFEDEQPRFIVLSRDITERKQTEEQLRLNEQNLATTLQSIGDAVIATDAQGRITRMNGTAERLTGWTLSKARGIPLPEVFRIVNAKTRLEAVNPVQLVMERGAVVGLANHTALLSRDGKEYQISDSAAPIRNSVGQIEGVVLVFSDVTEDYRVRETLERTAELLRHTGELAHVGGWELDLRTMEFFWSPEVFRIHEMSPPVTPTLEQSMQLFQPAVQPVIKAAMQAAIDHGTPYDLELPKFTATGRPIWVRAQCSVVVEDGKSVKLIGALHDITTRKQAEKIEQFRSRILELLASGEALPDLLTALVRGVEEIHPLMLCSILLLESDGRHLGKGVAPSLPDFYNAALDGVEIGLGVGSCGTAAFTGERVVVEDIATHPYWAPYKELAASAGLGACWSQPIFSSTGQVLGTFAIYHQAPHTPGASDIVLIEQSAGLASIAIERSVAAQKLLSSEAHYRLLTEDASDVVWRQDADNRFTYISPSDERMRGFRADEVVGRHVYDLLTEEGIALVASRMQARTAEEARGVQMDPEPFELQQRCKDGSLIWTEVVTRVDRDAQGTLVGFHGISRDITRRKAAEEQIRSLAFYDPLTQLPNRRLLMDRLEKALSTGLRHQRSGALLFVDLDNFKTLNDTLGHDKGDLLLQQVAQRLCTCVRDCDTVARLGGDEFVVMLEDLSANPQEAAAQAEVVGAKILAALNQNYRLASYEHHSTPSIGITLFGESNEGIDEPLKRADLAMYQAKAAGRNTLRFFDPKMQDVVTARAALEDGLRDALANHQFLLHYQAQVDSEGKTTGAEALVRWMHPTRGMVSPAEFIPLAEETSLILPLGSWVMETACTQLTAWAGHATTAHLTLSVNVSARQFHQNDFVAQVRAVLERTGANPQRLKLELTEGLLVSNIEDVIAKMTTLKSIGVGFSLDDFGTGYSSLSYLKRLPLDQLKIDQGFVRDILIDPNDAAIAKMVIVLANSLGLACIAEGVETQAQRSFLAGQGCHAYQGYLFSRPLPVAAFEAFLTART